MIEAGFFILNWSHPSYQHYISAQHFRRVFILLVSLKSEGCAWVAASFGGGWEEATKICTYRVSFEEDLIKPEPIGPSFVIINNIYRWH